MKLRLGQTIVIEGEKHEVVGILGCHTFNSYNLRKADGSTVWLDDCSGGWRLWEKSPSTKGRRIILNFLSWSAKDLVALLGQKDISALNVTIKAMGAEIVGEALGDVDDTEEGEKVFYIEGVFSSSSKRLPLFLVEVWDGEVEISEGKFVEIVAE